jgi:predicted nucleic acid-binding protein
MNGVRVLCDTNTLIHLLGDKSDVVDFLSGKQICISVITELELYGKQNITLSEVSIIDVLVESCFYLDIPLITFDSDFSKIIDLKLVLLKL